MESVSQLKPQWGNPDQDGRGTFEMIIQQKRVRTLKGKLPGIKKGSAVVFGAKLVPGLMPKLYEVGFPQNAGIGDAVLPTEIGPIPGVNAEGAVIVHRDRPL